jgi:hypothetical protein
MPPQAVGAQPPPAVAVEQPPATDGVSAATVEIRNDNGTAVAAVAAPPNRPTVDDGRTPGLPPDRVSLPIRAAVAIAGVVVVAASFALAANSHGTTPDRAPGAPVATLHVKGHDFNRFWPTAAG